MGFSSHADQTFLLLFVVVVEGRGKPVLFLLQSRDSKSWVRAAGFPEAVVI